MTIPEEPDQSVPPSTSDGPAGRRRRASRPRRRRLRRVALLVVVGMVPVGWSYGDYLTAAGNAPTSVRTVDWLRDHGFESAVSNIEQWWYTRRRPTSSGPSGRDFPLTASALSAVGVGAESRHLLQFSAGRWDEVAGLASPIGAVQQTYTQPDSMFRSVVADLVRFDQRKIKLAYVPGTEEPGGTGWAWKSQIPQAQRSHAVAAFNAGFKFRHTSGGVYTEGRNAVRPLAEGLASIVIRRDGTADIAKWGRDARLTADVVSVRQNLALIVDGGVPVAGLRSDRGGQWGSRKSQFQFTWRSALGVDAQNRLIYAAGRQMTLVDLANSMVSAGAVRAMQLDIHDNVVTFNWYRPDPKSANGVDSSKLMASMQRDATRFLSTEQRDFLAVMVR